jgi:flavin-binding protein dodecin
LSHAAVASTDARLVRRNAAAITVVREGVVEESVYRVIEVIGTSPTSWEEAARTAVETAGVTLEDLRVAEITELDMRLQDNKVMAYRAKVKISFKYRI